MKKIYVCNDTFTGIFSAIYDAWKVGAVEGECGIALLGMLEQELFCEYFPVIEHEHKVQKVENLIRKHLGNEAYMDIGRAVLAADRLKGEAILGTMIAARTLKDSHRIMEHLSHPHVEKVFELSRSVGGEAHQYTGFVRFRELENGVLYSRITPKNQILTCIAPHFSDRLPNENWMIHDQTHQMFAVHEAGKEWVLVWNQKNINQEMLDQVSDAEREYAKLWNGFCQTIAIESRKNPKCQLQHLPLRYRGDMTEFLSVEKTLASSGWK